MEARQMLEANLLFQEPIKKVNEEIDKALSSNHVAVLGGGRGTGKTSTLLWRERESMKTNHASIYRYFDNVGNGISYLSLDDSLIETYYELVFSLNLLAYFKTDGRNLLSHDDELLYHKINNERMQALKAVLYDCDLDKETSKVKHGTYTEEIIDKMKKEFQKDKLTLMIDRFDWMDGRSYYSQEFISRYFDMFDKVILTTDDPNYSSKYPLIECDYGIDMNTVLKILKKFCVLNNSERKNPAEEFDPDDINASTISYLFEQADGNIALMENVIKGIYYYNHDKTITTEGDLINYFMAETDDKIRAYQKVRDFSTNNDPRFHIQRKDDHK